MTASEVIEQFKALPPNEKAKVSRFVVEHEDSWVPESFQEGMADIAAGRVVDLDVALSRPYPSKE
jgi:predicted transcriptional regulator